MLLVKTMLTKNFTKKKTNHKLLMTTTKIFANNQRIINKITIIALYFNEPVNYNTIFI